MYLFGFFDFFDTSKGVLLVFIWYSEFVWYVTGMEREDRSRQLDTQAVTTSMLNIEWFSEISGTLPILASRRGALRWAKFQRIILHLSWLYPPPYDPRHNYSSKHLVLILECALCRPKGQTVLCIAHRLSTIKQADLIVFLGKDGTVQETGTFLGRICNLTTTCGENVSCEWTVYI